MNNNTEMLFSDVFSGGAYANIGHYKKKRETEGKCRYVYIIISFKKKYNSCTKL